MISPCHTFPGALNYFIGAGLKTFVPILQPPQASFSLARLQALSVDSISQFYLEIFLATMISPHSSCPALRYPIMIFSPCACSLHHTSPHSDSGVRYSSANDLTPRRGRELQELLLQYCHISLEHSHRLIQLYHLFWACSVQVHRALSPSAEPWATDNCTPGPWPYSQCSECSQPVKSQ